MLYEFHFLKCRASIYNGAQVYTNLSHWTNLLQLNTFSSNRKQLVDSSPAVKADEAFQVIHNVPTRDSKEISQRILIKAEAMTIRVLTPIIRGQN